MRWLVVALTCLWAWGVAAEERLTLSRSDGAKVPVLEFRPEAEGCAPVLIISHGFGGDERGHVVLAQEAARAGFRALTMAHRESGRAELRAALRAKDRRAAMLAAVTDREANAARMRDLDAVWSHAVAECKPPFTALAGHSMGAGLTMIEAGAGNSVGVTGKRRFDAYIALSPQGIGSRFQKGAWRGIKAPVLMVTGTRDRGLDGDWKHRLAAYDGLPAGNAVLAVLQGGTHMDVGGKGRPGQNAKVHRIVLAFLKARGRPLRGAMPEMLGVIYQRK